MLNNKKAETQSNISHYQKKQLEQKVVVDEQQANVDLLKRKVEQDTDTAASFCDRVPVTSTLEKLEKELLNLQKRSAEMSRV